MYHTQNSQLQWSVPTFSSFALELCINLLSECTAGVSITGLALQMFIMLIIDQRHTLVYSGLESYDTVLGWIFYGYSGFPNLQKPIAKLKSYNSICKMSLCSYLETLGGHGSSLPVLEIVKCQLQPSLNKASLL